VVTVTVNYPTFGTMCAICFKGLTPEECATDADGQRWDVCEGECARQAGIHEAHKGTEYGPRRTLRLRIRLWHLMRYRRRVAKRLGRLR
jgi:hypothetical protein